MLSGGQRLFALVVTVGSEWSLEGIKLQAPGGGNLLCLFEDRVQTVRFLWQKILKLPKAAAQDTWEVPCFCSRACCWFCGERIQIGTNQGHAGVLTLLFQPTGPWAASFH